MTDMFIVLFPVNNRRQQDLQFGHFLKTARGRWEVRLRLFSTRSWDGSAQTKKKQGIDKTFVAKLVVGKTFEENGRLKQHD